MPRGSSSPCILRSISGLEGVLVIPVPVSITFTSSCVIADGKDHADTKIIIQVISVLDGVDARLRQGGFEVLDAIVGEAHKLGYARSRAHCHFFETQPRWELYFHRCAPGLNHFVVPSLPLHAH